MYKIITPKTIENFIQILFENYNKKMEKINLKIRQINDEYTIEQLKQEKLEEIADLFQMLEWLHPYIDG